MKIHDYIKEKHPWVKEMVNEMKSIQSNWNLLPAKHSHLDVKSVPCYIMTYNRPFDNQPTYNHMKDHSHVVFVCSTDDPYLKKFKEECTEDVLVFNKSDYRYTDEENGDTHGLDQPFNQCGVFARRFLDDYTQRNGIKRYIVADNDLKMSIKMCDKKDRKFDYDPSLVDKAIRLYFYLLEKYEDVQYFTAYTPIRECFGKLYENGFDFNPVSLNFHLSSKPCRWISRFIDDAITPLKIYQESGKLALNLPLIRVSQNEDYGKGDMNSAYKAAYDEINDNNLMSGSGMTGSKYQLQSVICRYFDHFFPGYVKNGKRRTADLMKSLIEKYH